MLFLSRNSLPLSLTLLSYVVASRSCHHAPSPMGQTPAPPSKAQPRKRSSLLLTRKSDCLISTSNTLALIG